MLLLPPKQGMDKHGRDVVNDLDNVKLFEQQHHCKSRRDSLIHRLEGRSPKVFHTQPAIGTQKTYSHMAHILWLKALDS